MNSQTQALQALVEKIRALPAERIAEVADFVDFLRSKAPVRQPSPTAPGLLDFPVDHVGQWPADLGLSRQDLYSDDGR